MRPVANHVHVRRTQQALRQSRDNGQHRYHRQPGDEHLQEVELPPVECSDAESLACAAGEQPDDDCGKRYPAERAETEPENDPLPGCERREPDAPEDRRGQEQHDKLGPVQHGGTELRATRGNQPSIGRA